jgi:hypothetical protein
MELGKYAHLILLERDPTVVDPTDIRRSRSAKPGSPESVGALHEGPLTAIGSEAADPGCLVYHPFEDAGGAAKRFGRDCPSDILDLRTPKARN